MGKNLFNEEEYIKIKDYISINNEKLIMCFRFKVKFTLDGHNDEIVIRKYEFLGSYGVGRNQVNKCNYVNDENTIVPFNDTVLIQLPIKIFRNCKTEDEIDETIEKEIYTIITDDFDENDMVFYSFFDKSVKPGDPLSNIKELYEEFSKYDLSKVEYYNKPDFKNDSIDVLKAKLTVIKNYLG